MLGPKMAEGGSRGRSFYSATIEGFLRADTSAIVGQLASRHVGVHASAEGEQVRAWTREIELLREVFGGLGAGSAGWSLLLEAPLMRLGKRLDAVILLPGVVVVVEFKIGANAYDGQDRRQTERYAQSLRDFHQVSQSQVVAPVLCAENAPTRPLSVSIVDGVADLLLCNAQTLQSAIALLADAADNDQPVLDASGFDYSAYTPTPTIVEAAQALYAGHQIADIGRGDAADAELQRTAAALREIVASAEQGRQKVICFVTGTPGAGKTLLGLDLALMNRSGETPAALLSGNRPLVHVLTEALAIDTASRLKVPKARAKYEADAAIQNLLGYLKEHTDGPPPPEHAIVFDEAQRAWDAEVGKRLMGRPESEPDLFLKILDRMEWACLVCLVGPGQEINRGEGGLELWGEALARASLEGRAWKVLAADQAIRGGPDVAGGGLTRGLGDVSVEVASDRRLHLASSMRAYRNPLYGQWVAALLEGEIERAAEFAARMTDPPAYLTRNLDEAKAWLRRRRRGGRSVGLLVSSGGVRLVGEGLPPAPLSNQLDAIGHWFLKPYTDYRSAGALEIPMSEFACQGLELDFTGVCWGGDLIWKDGEWTPRIMRAPKWQTVRDQAKRAFRMNGYRVLLTRGRAGSVIYVPLGSKDDPTRAPAEGDAVAEILVKSGCRVLQ
jgi:hypothetical protein